MGVATDRVADADSSSGQGNGHDTGLAHDLAVCSAVQYGGEQAGAEILDLAAGIAQPGHFKNDLRANAKQCAPWQAKQVDPARCNVFAEL